MTITRTLPVLACLLAAPAAFATDIVNGGFELQTPLFGWTTSGLVSVVSTNPAPSQDAKCVLLTSGNTAAADVATLLGTTTAALTTAAGTSTIIRDGACIVQTVTVNEGDDLMFDWKFNNGEETNNTAWPDTCYVVINGEPTRLATSASSPAGWMPAYSTSTKTTLAGGTYKIGFAVFNFADFAANSQLAVDAVRIIHNSSPCSPADVGTQGGLQQWDYFLDNNDFVAFIDMFFQRNARADLGVQGGTPGHDGLFDNNDFVVFINFFFTPGPECQG